MSAWVRPDQGSMRRIDSDTLERREDALLDSNLSFLGVLTVIDTDDARVLQ